MLELHLFRETAITEHATDIVGKNTPNLGFRIGLMDKLQSVKFVQPSITMTALYHVRSTYSTSIRWVSSKTPENWK